MGTNEPKILRLNRLCLQFRSIAHNSKINEIPRFSHPQGRIGEINNS